MRLPEAWPPFDHGTCRYLLQRFPFSVVYRIEDRRILIVAGLFRSHKIDQLRGHRPRFGSVFQPLERVRRSPEKAPTEDFRDEPSPPAWREDEVSIERDATRVPVDRRDLYVFVIGHSKGQPHIKYELLRRTHVEYVDHNPEHARSKGEVIARAYGTRGRFDQRGSGPLRQSARVGEQVPNALSGRADHIGRADIHSTQSTRDELNRAAVVNVRWVSEVQADVGGALILHLRDDRQTRIAVAPARIAEVKSRLGL